LAEILKDTKQKYLISGLSLLKTKIMIRKQGLTFNIAVIHYSNQKYES